jgi:uncharacterized coiled-coil protein SlyX
MNPNDTRLDDVEARIAWLEKTVSELDEVVRALGDELRLMNRDLTQLREQRSADGEEGSGLKYEVPPHY